MFFYNICCRFYLLVAGVTSSKVAVNFDYSYYLGPNYKQQTFDQNKTSTIVCNHVSWLDPVVMIKEVAPAFAPSSEFKGKPLLGTLIDALDSIYIPRGGSEESR